MNDQISNLTEQSFPEIRRNDRSLNESIWTPKCDKLHVFDMVEKMRKKKVCSLYVISARKQKLIHFVWVNY